MPAAIVAAAFEHVDEAFEIGVDVSVRMVGRITHAGLRREMDHDRETMLLKQGLRRRAVRQVELREGKAGTASQDLKPRLSSSDRNSR